MVFKDGIPGWIDAGYTIKSTVPLKKVAVSSIEPKQLNDGLANYLVVDIRPENAYVNGYVPGSRAMPLAYLSMLYVEIPKTSKIVVVDHKGKQCKTAAQWLKNNGYDEVLYLRGGLSGYAAAGFRLEKD